MTDRSDRVAEEIRSVLARVLREDVRDPRIGFVTLTGVDLSADLRQARVRFSTLEDGASRDEALAALRRAAPFLQRSLARRSGLRFVPRLTFEFDATLETGARVERLIRDMHRERHDRGEDPEGDA